MDPISLQRRAGNQTFGRRLGRPLSASRRTALKLLDQLSIDPSLFAQPGTLNPRTLFPRAVDQVWFEIGFGAGEHLRARLEKSPAHGFIGAEPYINGTSTLLMSLTENGQAVPNNLRLHMNDALPIIRALTDASLNGIYLLNSDPWPKKKHHKRRVINPDNLAEFARVIKPGGSLVISTDVADLATWTVEHLAAVPHLFTPDARTVATPSSPPDDWPLITRYMAKGHTAGRTGVYLVYKRVQPTAPSPRWGEGGAIEQREMGG